MTTVHKDPWRPPLAEGAHRAGSGGPGPSAQEAPSPRALRAPQSHLNLLRRKHPGLPHRLRRLRPPIGNRHQMLQFFQRARGQREVTGGRLTLPVPQPAGAPCPGLAPIRLPVPLRGALLGPRPQATASVGGPTQPVPPAHGQWHLAPTCLLPWKVPCSSTSGSRLSNATLSLCPPRVLTPTPPPATQTKQCLCLHILVGGTLPTRPGGAKDIASFVGTLE